MFNFTEKSFISSLFFSCILLTSIIAIPIKTFGETILHGGQEFQINTHTASEQIRPSVATLLNGNFVVVWQSKHQDGSNIDIYAQIFNESGNKIDDEFQVNTYAAGDQKCPSVVGLNNGNFVVVWSSDGQDGDSWGVYAQIFDANGSKKIDDDILVNTHVTNVQDHPFVAAFDNNNFVVAWHSKGANEDNICAQIFNPSGGKIHNEIQVNTHFSNDQWFPAITILKEDKFVVAWHSYRQGGNGNEVYAQIFDSSGKKVGNEFQVNTETTDNQCCVSVTTLNNGNFVASWHSYNQDGSDYGIYAQILNEDGDKIRNELQVNTYTSGQQIHPSVAVLDSGNFIITWRSYNDQDGDLLGVFGQIFSESGAKLGDEFQINIYTTSHQYGQHVASFKNGSFVVVWQSLAQDGDNYGIFGRIFTPNMIPTIGDLTKVGVKNTALLFDKTDFTDLFTDADGHSMTKIKITSLPGGGSLKLLSYGAVIEGQEMDVDDIEYLVFDPNEGWTGTTFFGWQGFDGKDYSDAGSVAIELKDEISDDKLSNDEVSNGALPNKEASNGESSALTWIVTSTVGPLCTLITGLATGITLMHYKDRCFKKEPINVKLDSVKIIK